MWLFCDLWLKSINFKLLEISNKFSILHVVLCRDSLLPVTLAGLVMHLLITYGVTNKPLIQVSKGEWNSIFFSIVFFVFFFLKLFQHWMNATCELWSKFRSKSSPYNTQTAHLFNNKYITILIISQSKKAKVKGWYELISLSFPSAFLFCWVFYLSFCPLICCPSAIATAAASNWLQDAVSDLGHR